MPLLLFIFNNYDRLYPLPDKILNGVGMRNDRCHSILILFKLHAKRIVIGDTVNAISFDDQHLGSPCHFNIFRPSQWIIYRDVFGVAS